MTNIMALKRKYKAVQAYLYSLNDLKKRMKRMSRELIILFEY